MTYQELNGISIRQGFEKFDEENPHIYIAFEEQCLSTIDKSRRKISAKLIVNWIRWNKFLESSDQNFKINDAYQSYYARKFVDKFPEHDQIFNFRKLRNEDPSPYMEVDSGGNLTFL